MAKKPLQDVNMPISGTSIELIFRSPDGTRHYVQTPVENDSRLLKYVLAKFVDQWMRDTAHLQDGHK